MSEPTILIVDDEEANIDILVEMLADNFDIAVAMDGESALEAVADSEEIWKYLIATNRVKLVSEFTHKEPTPSLETVDPETEEE